MTFKLHLASIVVACATVLGGTAGAQPYSPAYYSDADPSALHDFRSTLAPYGQWIEHPTYGTVWVPSRRVVGANFTPYVTAGHWAYDDTGGYVWVSNYSWGWAPFHYGRWLVIANVGWAWIPGGSYAGAWVDWRIGDATWDYVGWRPLPPTFIWRHGRPVRYGHAPHAPYAYIPHRSLFDRDLRGYVQHGPGAARIERHTREYTRAPGVHYGGPPPHSWGRQRPPIVRPPHATPRPRR